MATVIIAAVIFGYAGYVVFKKVKSKGSCEDESCNCNCAAKVQKRH